MSRPQRTDLVIKVFPSSPSGVWFSQRFSRFLHRRVYYREFRFSATKAFALAGFVALLMAWAVVSLGLNYVTLLEASRQREQAVESTRALVRAKRDFVTLYARLRPMNQKIHRMDQLARKLAILVGSDPAKIPAFERTEAPSPAEIENLTELLYARFNEYHTMATDRQFEMDHTPSISPLRDTFVVTSRFGMRVNRFVARASGGPDEDYGMSFHSALDLAAPIGTPIYASADGLVVFSGSIAPQKSIRGGRYGKFVTIDHLNGIKTHYAHCDRLNVVEGQRVRRGDLVATVGNTGRSTGPHLHYEVVVGKTPVNPEWYISDRDLFDPSATLETVDLSQTSELDEELASLAD